MSRLFFPTVFLLSCLVLCMTSYSEARTLPDTRCPAGFRPSIRACRLPATSATPISGSGTCCSCPGGSFSATGASCARCTDGVVVQHGVDVRKSGAQCSCIDGYGDWDPSTLTCRRCPANSYSSNNKCVPCAAGTFAPAQSSSCVAVQCPSDSYLAPGGSTFADCTRCKFGTASQSCSTVQACQCLNGYAGFSNATGQCTQCPGTNSIAVFADLNNPDPSFTVCVDCPPGFIASPDRVFCLAPPPSNGMPPQLYPPNGNCVLNQDCFNYCFVDTETSFALDTPELQSRVISSVRSPAFANQSNVFTMEFERRLVDDADRLCPSTTDEVCALPIRRVQLLHLRPGDYILAPRATGAPQLKQMHLLSHPVDFKAASADITTLYYTGADGSSQSISLTADHMVNVVSGASSESLPQLPTEAEFMNAPLSDRDVLGDSGPLSLRQVENLRAAGDIVVGDYIWHQPLPGSGADVNTDKVFRAPKPVLVRVERVQTEVKFGVPLQVPLATSFLYSVSGTVANSNSEPSVEFFQRARFATAAVWLMEQSPEAGRYVLDFVYRSWELTEAWATSCIIRAVNDQDKMPFTTILQDFTTCSLRHASNSRWAKWIGESLSTIIAAGLLSIGAASLVRYNINSGKNTRVCSN